MPAYKLKSLLYLLVFIFCAWLYTQVDEPASGSGNQPMAEVTSPQAQPVTQTANGL